uniref:Secreted protein n=1 Tax=Angiostrongylus cantonensis TaxID=6313 RepID=A0A0K0CTC5_ANGCA
MLLQLQRVLCPLFYCSMKFSAHSVGQNTKVFSAMWRVVLIALPTLVTALLYRCENDEVLIVQNFGNDTIRMHCQRLDMCGYQNLVGCSAALQPSVQYSP